jgi:predicted NBD/HSP70 family sugar kinase
MRDSANEVLRALATSGPLSRAQLARDLGLSGPTLTQATRSLMKLGLIAELDQTPSTGGRPATLLGLVAGAGMVMGVKLADDHLFGICVDLESQIQFSFEEKFKARGDEAIDALSEILLKQSRRVRGQLLGIGVGLPGVVSQKDLSTTTSVMLGWDQVKLGEILSKRLKTPVLCENDVNTLAMSESLYGRGKDISNLLTITIGRGVGSGIIINGELYAGTHGAGEIGHVKVVGNKLKCECGNIGCLETIASDPAILRAAKKEKLISANAGMEQLWLAARNNKAVASKCFKEPAQQLGIAIANVINIFGPELVVVSGEGSGGWDIWERWLVDAIRENVVPTLSNFDIEIDPWDDAKWASGAIAIVMQATLSRRGVDFQPFQEVKDRLRILGEKKIS